MGKRKVLYKAEIRLPDTEYTFLQRLGLVEEMPLKEAYRYAYSEKQARFIFEKLYPPDSILRITREIKSE